VAAGENIQVERRRWEEVESGGIEYWKVLQEKVFDDE